MRRRQFERLEARQIDQRDRGRNGGRCEADAPPAAPRRDGGRSVLRDTTAIHAAQRQLRSHQRLTTQPKAGVHQQRYSPTGALDS
jgi:hypothetical protein